MPSAIAHSPEPEGVVLLDPQVLAPRLVIEDEATGDVGRRGPFRPGRLVPARARMQVRSLSRIFRVIDGLVFAGVTAAAISIVRPTPDVFAPLVLGGLALLPALYLLEAYTFHRRETLGRQALRVSAAFGVVGVVVLLATLIFGHGQIGRASCRERV